MGSVRLVLGIGVGAFALAACGSAGAGSDESGPLVSTPLTTTTQPAGALDGSRSGPAADDRGPTFPLTLRRTGGIAGFDDTVVLKPSGEVLVETRSVHGRVCVLPRPQRERLFTVLATLRPGGLAPTGETGGSGPPVEVGDPGAGPTGSDLIRISLTDARRHPFDLADPSLGSVSDMVGAFVADVTLSSPATITCTTRHV